MLLITVQCYLRGCCVIDEGAVLQGRVQGAVLLMTVQCYLGGCCVIDEGAVLLGRVLCY